MDRNFYEVESSDGTSFYICMPMLQYRKSIKTGDFILIEVIKESPVNGEKVKTVRIKNHIKRPLRGLPKIGWLHHLLRLQDSA